MSAPAWRRSSGVPRLRATPIRRSKPASRPAWMPAGATSMRIAAVGLDAELRGGVGEGAGVAGAGDDRVEEVGDAGQLERRAGPFAARRDRDLLAALAQFADPGDRAGQRPHVAVAEVGRRPPPARSPRRRSARRRSAPAGRRARSRSAAGGRRRRGCRGSSRAPRRALGHRPDAEHDGGDQDRAAGDREDAPGDEAALVVLGALVPGFQRGAHPDPGDDQDESPKATEVQIASSSGATSMISANGVMRRPAARPGALSDPGPKTGVSEIVSFGSRGCACSPARGRSSRSRAGPGDDRAEGTAPEQFDDREDERRGRRRGGQGEEPAGDDVARHLPVDLGARPSHPGAADRAGDDLRGRQRVADVRGGEDHGGGDRLRAEALGGRTSTTLVPSVLMIRQPPE